MKLYGKSSLMLFPIFFLFNLSFGQQKQISGKVFDETGKPVAYASITFEGSSYGGTWTDENGYYATNIPDGYELIMSSHLNYVKKIEKIEGNNIINFVLEKKIPQQSFISVTGTHKYTAEELKVQKKRIAVDNNKVFMTIEASASFYGGEGAFKKYLQKEIVYPDSATISDVKGVVKVSFTIDKNGLVKNITLLKGVNKFTDELVLKAISKMQKWVPAVQNGRNVEQYREVSVSFDIIGNVP